jgi:hypothetical protein
MEVSPDPKISPLEGYTMWHFTVPLGLISESGFATSIS